LKPLLDIISGQPHDELANFAGFDALAESRLGIPPRKFSLVVNAYDGRAQAGQSPGQQAKPADGTLAKGVARDVPESGGAFGGGVDFVDGLPG